MTASNADRSIALTIDRYEGGFDNDRRDRGNWTSGKIGEGELKGTKYGIAAFVYPDLDIKNLTKDQAVAIYKRDYWPKVAADILPTGIDFTSWDCCVNSGASRALKCLGKALGATNLGAPASSLAQLAVSAGDKVSVIKDANEARRTFLIGLHNATYQNGWLKRVAHVEATSISWYMESINKPKEEIKKTLEKEATTSDKKVKTSGASAGGAGAGGAATAGHATQQGFDLVMLIEVGLTIALVATVIYFGYKLYAHRNRAQAMKEVSAAL